MKKLTRLVLASLVSFAVVGNVHAAATTNKIGVIDVETIYSKSSDAKKLNDDIATKFKPRQKKIIALEKKLRSDSENLARNSAVLGDAEKEKLQSKIVSERRDLARMQQDFQQDLSVARAKAQKSFIEKVRAAVAKVAKAKGYDLVLQKNSLPFASERTDITKQVTAALDS